MKKRRPTKPHMDNIFLFPNVDKLLMEKGLDRLKTKKYSEAIEYLEKAQELDQDNEEIGLGLIVAYFESGNLSEAKKRAHESLQKGFGDYFQLIDIYIMILLQLNEYELIVTTLQVLIDEREIPFDKLENFTRILEFSKRKLESSNRIEIDEFCKEDFNLFEYKSLNEQFLAIANLSQANVRAFLKGIRQYLGSTEGHPFIKTMLLQLLSEQEINGELEVEKFNKKQIINPTLLPNIELYLESPDITNILKKEVEQENPTLYESIKSIIKRHSFILYPLERTPSIQNLWAAAYHYIALEYYGETISIGKIAEKYQVQQSDLIESITFIKELEEISSPIL